MSAGDGTDDLWDFLRSTDQPSRPGLGRYLHALEVARQLGISVRTLRRWVQQGWFPRGTPLGPGTVRWEQRAVLKWLKARKRGAS